MTIHPTNDWMQDAMRRAWAADIPNHLRPQARKDGTSIAEGGERGAARMAEKHRAQRDQLAARVMDLRREGMTLTAIAQALGSSRWIVTRIVEDAKA